MTITREVQGDQLMVVREEIHRQLSLSSGLTGRFQINWKQSALLVGVIVAVVGCVAAFFRGAYYSAGTLAFLGLCVGYGYGWLKKHSITMQKLAIGICSQMQPPLGLRNKAF